MIRIEYNSGRILQGVVLSFGDGRVRIAVKGWDDAFELRLVNGVWVSEDCEVVKLHFADQPVAVESEDSDPFETLFRLEGWTESLRRVM